MPQPPPYRIPLRRRGKLLLAICGLFIVTGVTAVALWPEHACSDPACAKRRFSVAIEVDSFAGAQVPPTELQTNDGMQSVQMILASGGIDASITVDQTDLPYDVSQGRLDRADLFRYFQAWRSMEATEQYDARIYALITKAGIAADNGEHLFGMMFDFDGREGFAVAPSETINAFSKREAAAVPALQFRTFLHELLHTLNRGHLDAAQRPDGRLTLEAPTKCISNAVKGAWSLREQPLFSLSPTTIRFFQTGTSQQVLPGSTNNPFERGRASATECDSVRMNHVEDPITSKWALIRRRFSLNLFASASAAEPEAAAAEDGPQPEDLTVLLQAQPAAYPLGYPVAVRVIASNHSEHAVPLKGRLAPSYGVLRLEIQAAGSEDWRVYMPLAWFEPAGDEDAMLAPGESTEQTLPIYFGEGGWTFPEPGEYRVRAQLVLGDESEQVTSEAVTVRIEAPRTEQEIAALETLFGTARQLDPDVGQLLSFGGRAGPSEELAKIEQLVANYPQTAIAAAMKLTLASRHLRPELNPLTGLRPAPQVQAARELLADACSDSGVAALKMQLLARHLQPEPQPSTVTLLGSEADAWDGATRAGKTRPATYSNPQLRPYGTSLHFCVDDAALRGTALKEANQLARALRKNTQGAIVVIGHADSSASCKYNDTLALQRAETFRRLLLAQGIPSKRVTAVSLGKRRPLDFAATPEAAALNRRVEVLVERVKEEAQDTAAPQTLPRCRR